MGAHTSELLVAFRASTREQVLAVANVLLMVPALSERSLVALEIAYAARAHVVCVCLRFDRERLNERARARLKFWCARAGGALRAASSSAHLSTPVAVSDADASRLMSAVKKMCTEAGHDVALSPPVAPFLVIDAAGPATAGIVYDAARRRLFVPCPVAPPVGDSLVLEIVLPPPGRQRVRAFARVDEVRPPAAASPGSAAGFALGLGSEAPSMHAALVAALQPSVAGVEQRAAARVRTAAPVHVAPAPADTPRSPPNRGGAPASLRDISHRGAFIRTTHPAPVGSRVRISMQLHDGADFEAIANVVHVAADGMGVQFRLDAYGEARLAEALTSMTGRSQRVLVVDDDALARRMMADAFESRGFDVLTAASAELGLHVLAAEILSLDALVTDVRMPGIDGEELVRRIRGAGGEHDLPIVVATATLDERLASRLQAAGANRVLEKSSGPDAIVDATLAEISSRRTGAGAPVAVSAA